MARKILVVDDEPDVVTYLCTLLQEHGFQTACASDGEEGMRRVQEACPDLICLDILMPGKSGVLMYEELRTNPQWERVPVLIVTGFRPSDQTMVGFKRHLRSKRISPPQAYMEKPIDRQAFVREVSRALRQKLSDP